MNRSFRGKPKKQSTRVNPNEMMGQFQKVQADMQVAQSELEQQFFTYTAGGGALEVIISGHQRIQSIKIDPEMLTPDDAETLQSLLVSTINQAIEDSQAKAAERMEGLTSNLGVNDLLNSMGGLGALGF